ncbi:CpsD/CapB family tyrosine-protein kinase [Loktanella sp. M215]|uniref:CpsD/CapB family tyrosine-protein kinase n=1 Tax=Loktanella sp. M215 TaxID=2675431 RepID=UPI001F2CB94D|nr:CpsD/CapB family tyrosine-protein kinase [Loktanella sp. M215]MCF7702182.1 P-loop NTPase [Loktanella sp. M215]
MEKIRSAIAKARAERDAAQAGIDTPTPPRTGPAFVMGRPAELDVASPEVPQADAGFDTIAANWAALPVTDLDADQMRRNRIVSFVRSTESTGVDMMRTRILQQMRDNNWRRVAITSPTSACGKSTIALNLAVSLSRQPDMRSLLLEMDLRRPSLARMLGITPPLVDFSNVLRGKADFAKSAVCYGGNVAVGLNGTKVRDASELLSSARISNVLSEIEATYAPDITIFDMPPMLAADDMMAFATQVDCVLIIAAAEKTTTKEIDLCEQELARQTNVMGVVLNECRYIGPEANYGYYG